MKVGEVRSAVAFPEDLLVGGRFVIVFKVLMENEIHVKTVISRPLSGLTSITSAGSNTGSEGHVFRRVFSFTAATTLATISANRGLWTLGGCGAFSATLPDFELFFFFLFGGLDS